MTWIELLNDHTFQTVFAGTMGIGAVSGAIGCLAYLRQQSLVGDVISHSSLLGIVLFFLFSYWLTGAGSKSLLVLIPGAISSGVVALWFAKWITSQSNVRADSGLGVMLAIFFGTGVLLLNWINQVNPPIPGRRGLKDYLFGMATSMTQQDLILIAVLGGISIGCIMLFWKEIKVYTFDPELSQSLGIRTNWIELLLIVLLVLGIVVGIQCIGVVLMIAILITPAASARQWTKSLGTMMLSASLIGATCAGTGTIISSQVSGLPTGPTVVLVGVLFFLFSITCSPQPGSLGKSLRRLNSNSAGKSKPTCVKS